MKTPRKLVPLSRKEWYPTNGVKAGNLEEEGLHFVETKAISRDIEVTLQGVCARWWSMWYSITGCLGITGIS